MTYISTEGKDKLRLILDDLIIDTLSKSSELKLYTFVPYNKTLVIEVFSQNIDEYLYYRISQNITSTFKKGIENSIKKFSEYLIQSQEGQLILDPEKTDLKFKLKNGEVYSIDIKSKFDFENFNDHYFKVQNEKAKEIGSKYKLFIYDEDIEINNDFLLNGNDFWELIAGFEQAKYELFKIINGCANKISLSTIIKDAHKRLLNEWKME